ncbi:DNA (cytosine-5-)-methyltransferase [Maritalea porphyrae]|uniref:DNA (cytosine-5-)-methyltransferase n=1 Tax=Maritalea porphyrae TaxID=880732 RepID=UPI0022B008F8|nr:DNA (cytosine-5-)-methyltransferase [Maritalea porphyrae]MCZ4274013.1 DNA (cytosine-5-)-methyltransferase [Maritalea porphyrae]
MRFGSVCSGIEAASVAWESLGFKPAFFSEIEKFPSNLLQARYPDVPNLGDMTKYKEWLDYAIDLLVGGTPCQSFSVAGLRKGLSDPRGNLALTYLAIAEKYQPRWILWENVPGVLSSNEGRDFGAFVGGLAQLGYGWAYRVLDAQYCRVDGFPRAVPQSRRRVFVVGYLGDWRSAAAVLFDAKSLRRDSAPRHETGQDAAGTLSSRTAGGGGLGTDFDLNGGVHDWPTEVTAPINASFGSKLGLEDQHALGGASMFVPDTSRPLLAKGNDSLAEDLDSYVATAFLSKDYGADAQNDVTPTLRAMNSTTSHQNGGGQMAVAFPLTSGMSRSASRLPHEQGALVPANYAVRRLTPTECERLQGFPDNYTLVPHTHGKPAADGPRYKALGNSMAVNVMRVLGARIKMVDEILGELV